MIWRHFLPIKSPSSTVVNYYDTLLPISYRKSFLNSNDVTYYPISLLVVPLLPTILRYYPFCIGKVLILNDVTYYPLSLLVVPLLPTIIHYYPSLMGKVFKLIWRHLLPIKSPSSTLVTYYNTLLPISYRKIFYIDMTSLITH